MDLERIEGVVKIKSLLDISREAFNERESQKISSWDLAVTCDVPLYVINHIEDSSRCREVSVDKVLKILNTLGIDLFIKRRDV